MERAENKTWIPPTVDLESNFEKDLRAETVSAPRRLALYICKRLSSVENNDAVELLETGVDPLAGGLMGLIDKGTVKYTRAEAAILYDLFLQEFAACSKKTEEELSINWRVDYGPDRNLVGVLQKANMIIEANRNATGGPKTPQSWGVGMKCSYRVSKGCATFRDNVIDNKGCLLKKNPWQTFFDSDLPEDEEKAKLLQPEVPYDLEKRFFNRAIARQMGYTFQKDAEMLANTSNWGVVSYLIETVKGDVPRKVGFNVLKIAGCRYNNSIQLSIIRQLNEAGLPLLENKTYYENEPLFNILELTKSSSLGYFLEDVKAPRCGDYRLKRFVNEFACSISNRYIGVIFDKYAKKEFGRIMQFWAKMMLCEGERIYDKDSQWKQEKFLMVLRVLKDFNHGSWSREFKNYVDDLINLPEKLL